MGRKGRRQFHWTAGGNIPHSADRLYNSIYHDTYLGFMMTYCADSHNGVDNIKFETTIHLSRTHMIIKILSSSYTILGTPLRQLLPLEYLGVLSIDFKGVVHRFSENIYSTSSAYHFLWRVGRLRFRFEV
jgi:hypothetical protein